MAVRATSHGARAAARLGLWEWNIEDDSVFWSPESFRVVGVDRFDGSLASFRELVHPDDAGELWERVDGARRRTSGPRVRAVRATPSLGRVKLVASSSPPPPTLDGDVARRSRGLRR